MAIMAFIRRQILADRPAYINMGWTIAVIAASTLLRATLLPGVSIVPYVTFYPSILFCAVFLSWRCGVLAMLGCGTAAWALPLGVPFTQLPLASMAFAAVLYLASGSMLIATGAALRWTVRQLDAAVIEQRRFNDELQHRTRNLIGVVQSLAYRAARTGSAETFYDSLSGQLVALAKANELLRYGQHNECKLHELVTEAVSPFPQSQFCIGGPRFTAAQDACVPLVLALHELATNATKYGALSAEGGTITIAWEATRAQARDAIAIDWIEAGGPPVRLPRRKGMGSRLLPEQKGLVEVSTEFAREGVRCRIVIFGEAAVGDPVEAASAAGPATRAKGRTISGVAIAIASA